MEMHNIINISSTNIKKWFNNINNEMADILFKKCYEFNNIYKDYNGWNIPNVVYWFPIPKLPIK